MTENAVFILSDIHFNALTPDRRAGVARFLREVVRRRARHLYLNGDIVDFIRGDRPPNLESFYLFKAAIDDVLAEGIPVTYIIGNHDLPLLTFLPPATPEAIADLYADRPPRELAPGLSLLYRAAVFEYEGHRVRIEHGHVYETGWLMTPRQELSLRRTLPLTSNADWMDAIVSLFDAFSEYGEDQNGRLARTYSLIPPYDSARYAVRMMQRQNAADWFVLGHFHAPTLESLEGGGLYANTGDSQSHGGYVVLTEGHLRLGDWRELVG